MIDDLQLWTLKHHSEWNMILYKIGELLTIAYICKALIKLSEKNVKTKKKCHIKGT